MASGTRPGRSAPAMVGRIISSRIRLERLTKLKLITTMSGGCAASRAATKYWSKEVMPLKAMS